MSKVKVLAGFLEVRVNGETLRFKGDGSYNFQNFTRKKIAGRDGTVHGDKLEPNVPMIKGKYSYDGVGLTTKKLMSITDATVVGRKLDGSMVVLRGAAIGGEIEPNLDEGEVELTWEGEEGEELGA